MKRMFIFIIIFVFLATGKSFADGSHECDVEKIDVGKTKILVYVNNCQLVSGTAGTFSQGDGFSNDSSGSQSYLWLARDGSEVEQTKHQLSMVLAAQTGSRRMVFRWNHDSNNLAVIDYLLIK